MAGSRLGRRPGRAHGGTPGVHVLGSACVGAFVLAIGALDVLDLLGVLPARPELPARAVSDALTGPAPAVARAAFLSLAVGGVCRALEARRREEEVLAVVLSGYSVGVAVAGLTPPHGAVHAVAAGVALLAVPVAIGVARQGPRIRAVWLAVVLASFGTWGLRLGGAWGFGCGERLTIALETAWLLASPWAPRRRRGAGLARRPRHAPR